MSIPRVFLHALSTLMCADQAQIGVARVTAVADALMLAIACYGNVTDVDCDELTHGGITVSSLGVCVRMDTFKYVLSLQELDVAPAFRIAAHRFASVLLEATLLSHTVVTIARDVAVVLPYESPPRPAAPTVLFREDPIVFSTPRGVTFALGDDDAEEGALPVPRAPKRSRHPFPAEGSSPWLFSERDSTSDPPFPRALPCVTHPVHTRGLIAPCPVCRHLI